MFPRKDVCQISFLIKAFHIRMVPDVTLQRFRHPENYRYHFPVAFE